MGAKSRVDNAQGCDLAPIFGDLSQSKKLSEIKPPLLGMANKGPSKGKVV